MSTLQSRITKSMIRRSHERQFNGVDYQRVAQDLADEIPDCTDDEYNELTHGPEPDCDCGFCKTAPWLD